MVLMVLVVLVIVVMLVLGVSEVRGVVQPVIVTVAEIPARFRLDQPLIVVQIRNRLTVIDRIIIIVRNHRF